MKQTIIGLSGHIDHGKTSLVKALTGKNTDSLSEEQKRGMTIDLGFAFLDDNTTLIDVPGHERFVKNMMAGISGIDIALLVIAADDSVMPQTKEHFEILNLLNIPLGIIVINKIDLVDENWLELVELEIKELVDNSFMEDSPIIKVSAETGEGVDHLKQILKDFCNKAPNKLDRGIFRLHVDRAFSVKGYGTVVTGTVNSGNLKIGDNIEISPNLFKAKVRGLQSHSKDVDTIQIGDRAAINLQGIDVNQVLRGSQIAEIGYLQSVNQVGVTIKLLPSSKKPIVQNQRVRIHLGTQEVIARVAIVNTKTLEPGHDCPALLRLEAPMVLARGDRFIIRSFSPILTIGGGEVIEVSIFEKWKYLKNRLQFLFDSDQNGQIIYIVESENSRPITQKSLQIRLGISKEKINQIVESIDELFWLNYKNGCWLLTFKQWDKLKSTLETYLKIFHEENPLLIGSQKEEIRQYLKCEDSILGALLEEMISDNNIAKKGEMYLDPSFSISLSPRDSELQDMILEQLSKEGFTSSNLNQLSAKIGKPKADIMRVLSVSEKEGKLLRIDGDLMFTIQNFVNLKNKLETFFSIKKEMSISDFKEMANTSRKYAVPLLEYFDKKKITYREGNLRKLVK